jgi:hypothetical protein
MPMTSLFIAPMEMGNRQQDGRAEECKVGWLPDVATFMLALQDWKPGVRLEWVK